MPDQISEHGEHHIPIEHGAAILPGASEIARERAEYEKAENERRDQDRDKLLLELQKKQTTAQDLQARSNVKIAYLTGALVFVSLVAGFVSYLQFQAAKRSADAAKDSADTAKSAAAIATDQTWKAIGNFNWIARTMDNAVQQSQRAAAVSAKQSRDALNATIEASRNDQRPWVGVLDTLPPTIKDRDVLYYLTPMSAPEWGVMVKNFGHSVSLNTRYALDVQVKQRGEAFSPEYTGENDRSTERSLAVLQPSVDTYITLRPVRLWTAREVASIADGSHRIYLFGKIVYTDIFSQTHTTTFCYYLQPSLRSFSSCGTYNDAN